jgi:selenide,water dikinase
MSGAKVLNEADTALVGGHTSEGAELAMGFAVNDSAQPGAAAAQRWYAAWRSAGPDQADGTGTLLAADMRMKAKGRWIDAALTSMVQSS